MISITNKRKYKRIIITPGEPAGIGPDVVIMAAQKKWPVELVVCSDAHLLLERAQKIQLPLKLRPYQYNNPPYPCSSGELSILNISLPKKITLGKLNITNSNYVINTLTRATQGCITGEFSALVTGPVHKGIINQAGIPFRGHTEFLSQLSNCVHPVMMLSSKKLRIALATTHIPIASVSAAITKNSLYQTVSILSINLKKYFKISYPQIYICSLNPHAGESGYIGKEEIEIIIPTLKILKKKNDFNIIGPIPADTIFLPKYLNNADVIVTMYHDQGLPVLKYSDFKQSINTTFGLPFIRTSVNHGTAIEISGTKTVMPDSIIMAISTAINMIQNSHE